MKPDLTSRESQVRYLSRPPNKTSQNIGDPVGAAPPCGAAKPAQEAGSCPIGKHKSSTAAATRRLRVFATPDGCEWVVARGEADAFRVREAYSGEPRDDWSMQFWRELPPNERLTIWADNESGRVTMVDDPEGAPITLTCAEWIKRQGRGWLATTEGS